MGAGSRSRVKEKRAKERRARKNAEKARYAAYAESGNNSKSARSKQRNSKMKSKIGSKRKHLVPHCGNTGCVRCFPNIDRRFPRNFGGK